MNQNEIRYFGDSDLNKNPEFIFALQHTIILYKKNILYTYIPKNACSTMRYTIAVDNNFISPNKDQFNWIHNNNKTFNASISQLILTKHSFVILRCPYRRIISSFLDKIVKKESDAWSYRNKVDRNLSLDNISFKFFLKSLSKKNIIKHNHHWRPQVDFLVYKNYENYFCLEEIDKLKRYLKVNNITFHDARELTNHGNEKLETIDTPCQSDIRAYDIHTLRLNGKMPKYTNFFDSECIDIVKTLYKEDIELYINKFGTRNIMFQ